MSYDTHQSSEMASAVDQIPDLEESLKHPTRHGLTKLHVACGRGDVQKVYKILAKYTPETVGSALDASDSYGRHPLCYAVIALSTSSIPIISMLIKCGAHVSSTDSLHRTAGHYACFVGAVECVTLLLENGLQEDISDVQQRTIAHLAAAIPDHSCLEGLTALHIACMFGHTSAANLLILSGASPLAVDFQGQTPAHWLASHGDYVDCLNILVWHKSDVIIIHDSHGRTLLHTAVASNNLEIVKTLVEYPNCDLDGRDSSGKSPLLWAAAESRLACVQILCTAGANPMVVDDEGATSIHYASICNTEESPEVMRTLLSGRTISHLVDKDYRTPLHWAATQCSPAASNVVGLIVKILIDSGCKVARLDKNGLTALHRAVSNQNLDALNVLCQDKEALDVADSQNHQTPLHLACQSGDLHSAKILLEAGAAVNIPDTAGRLALHYAATSNSSEILLAILSITNDASPRSADGSTVCNAALITLSLAGTIVSSQHDNDISYTLPTQHIVLLYDAKLAISWNLAPHDAYEPLHVASFTGNISVVTSLLSSGADRNALDDNNVSPLHWAAQCGHSSIVDVLLLGGAYPNFLDHSAGRGTPLDYALEAGHHDCANLLRQANGFTSKEIITIAATNIQRAFRFWKEDKMRRKALHKRLVEEKEAERKRLEEEEAERKRLEEEEAERKRLEEEEAERKRLEEEE
eukprot:gene6373-7487_t